MTVSSSQRSQPGLLTLCILSLTLSACGQIGPLYLPGEEPVAPELNEQETQQDTESEEESSDNSTP